MLALAKAVFVKRYCRRVDDDDAVVAINHNQVIVANQVAGTARAYNGWYAYAARHNGSVAGGAAYVGDKAFEHALAEMQHV